MKLLIKFKANTDIKDDCGTTPLMRACKKGHIDVATILLDRWVKSWNVMQEQFVDVMSSCSQWS